jgi:UDP-glucose 4-epimerase
MSSAEGAVRPAPEGLSLVLGAGGFLGCHVAAWLAGAGARVRLLDLSIASIPASIRNAPGCQVIQGNMLDEQTLERAVAGVDRVFHFVSATVPSTSVDTVDVEVASNLLPTVQLLETMRRQGVPLVLFPSSGGTIYGPGTRSEAFGEHAPLRPNCAHGLGKVLIEDTLRFYASRGGPDHLVLRISNPYGPTVRSHARQGVVNAFLEQARRGEPFQIWGDGSAVRDFLYVDDLLDAFAALLCARVSNQTYNLGSGRGHSIKEVAEVVARVTGVDPVFEWIQNEYAGVSYNVLDPMSLFEAVGWRSQVDLPTGIARTWEWMRSAIHERA